MRPRRPARRWSVGILAVLALLVPHTPASAATLYHQPVWFQWELASLDVLILPPGHGQIVNGNGALAGGDLRELTPYENSYLRAVETSVADWDLAVATYGASWLQAGLVTNVYVVGRDTVPQAALDDPEIVIAADHSKGIILGVAVHYSEGDENSCIVDNSKFFVLSFTYEDMYNVNNQEYGHCLGLDHSSGTPEDGVITHDVMFGSYRDQPSTAGTHKHCISNMNVLGLEKVFGPVFGHPTAPRVTIESTAYERMTC